MRKLTWAAAGFAAAAFLAEYLLPVQKLPYIAAAFALLGLLSPALRRWKGRACAAVLLLFGAAGLMAWWGNYMYHVAPCEALTGENVSVTVRVTEYPEQKDGYYTLPVRVVDGAPKEKAVLYGYNAALPDVAPGDILQAEIRVSSALGKGEERIHYFIANGQYLRGYLQSELTVVEKAGQSWLRFPQNLAASVKSLCRDLFSEDTAPFMTAILTGDTQSMQDNTEQYSDMRIAGVLHIVAVSGMHLLVLVRILEFFLGRSRRTSLLCFPVMLVFVLMAGCSASIVRAAVMQSILLLAPLVGRERDGITGIAAALLVILVPNPMAIGGVGLQLSFACVIGFEVLLPGVRKWMHLHLPMRNPIVRFVGDSVSASLCAVAFSTPVAACYFGTIPLLSFLANLLTLWVVELCFAMGCVVCVLGLFAPGGASLGAFVLNWCVRWCMLVYDWIAHIPFACLYTEQSPAVWWLAGVYMLWTGWYVLRRKDRRFGAAVPLCLCVIGLCGVILSGGAGFRPGTGEVTVLDVGQGQSVVLADESAVILVDCGGNGAADPGDTAANYLLASGKNAVDLLVLTHLHEDHTNGVEVLMSRIPVRTILLPAGADDEDDVLEEIAALAEQYETEIVELTRPCLAQVGEMALTLYLPQAGTDANERGIVVSAEVGEMTVLVMGDAGTDAELVLLQEGNVPDADVLVVGHHGSKTASSPLFLRAVEAETAVVSVGDNSYGLPAEETLETLAAYCNLIRRTDREGTITIQASEGAYG